MHTDLLAQSVEQQQSTCTCNLEIMGKTSLNSIEVKNFSLHYVAHITFLTFLNI